MGKKTAKTQRCYVPRCFRSTILGALEEFSISCGAGGDRTDGCDDVSDPGPVFAVSGGGRISNDGELFVGGRIRGTIHPSVIRR